MINNSAPQLWNRLAAKHLDQLFRQRILSGLNCSPFEAEAILQTLHDTYQHFFECAPGLQPGHLCLQVVAAEAPPGPKITQCPQVLVTLHWDDSASDLPIRKQGGVVALRRHRLKRLCHEAFQQGGLLTLEDLAYRLLNCGQRTLCRDLHALRQKNVFIPLRSTIQDIGRTLSHRTRIIELWLLGQEYSQIAKSTFHCVESVRNYVEKFKRLALLHHHGFDPHTCAFLARLSLPLTQQYLLLLRSKTIVPHRRAELRPDSKKNSPPQPPPHPL